MTAGSRPASAIASSIDPGPPLEGTVLVGERPAAKPGMLVDRAAPVQVATSSYYVVEVIKAGKRSEERVD